MNVQFTRGAHHVDNLTTLPTLHRDATTVTGREGPRKPIVSDIFNAIWTEARRLGAQYFGFTNADILVSQEVVDVIVKGGRDAYILAREDIDGATGRVKSVGIYGVDMFAIATEWWTEHRNRFRDYILGEAVWDNVYASVLMCHANAMIENRRPLVRHEAHPQNWTTAGPFADYQRLLAAYDATYFSLWCEYVATLLAMREKGNSAEDEDAMARSTFHWPPSLGKRATQLARNVKATLVYALARRWGVRS